MRPRPGSTETVALQQRTRFAARAVPIRAAVRTNMLRCLLLRSAVVGEVDEVEDAEIDLDEVKAAPIPQVIY